MAIKGKNSSSGREAIRRRGKTSSPKVTTRSERVVVDEIFDNGFVRLLRAKRSGTSAHNDLGISRWKDEQEDFMEAWRVEAFVGFPSQRHLREGDVFFVADGSKLTRKYKPIPREKARLLHLLQSWDESREFSRAEIKREFSRLSAVKISTGNKREIDELIRKVDKKFETVDPTGRKRGDG